MKEASLAVAGAGAGEGSVDEVGSEDLVVVFTGPGGGLDGIVEDGGGFEGVEVAEGVGVDVGTVLGPAGSRFSFSSPYSFHSSTSFKSCSCTQRDEERQFTPRAIDIRPRSSPSSPTQVISYSLLASPRAS